MEDIIRNKNVSCETFHSNGIYVNRELFHVKQQRGQTLSLPPSPDVGVKEKDMVK